MSTTSRRKNVNNKQNSRRKKFDEKQKKEECGPPNTERTAVPSLGLSTSTWVTDGSMPAAGSICRTVNEHERSQSKSSRPSRFGPD